MMKGVVEKVKLSEMEYKILSFLWDQDHRLTVKEISLYFDSSIQKINSYLTRMYKKGVLKKEVIDRYFLYSANITKTEYEDILIRDFSKEKSNFSHFKFAVALLGEKELTQEEKEELKKFLQ